MKVLDPGHLYELDALDGGPPERLQFVKREGEKFPGNVGHYPGTNLQEVLRALLNRVGYLNLQDADLRNNEVANHLKEAIYLLEERAAQRHGRKPPNTYAAVFGQTCKK